MPRLSSLFTVGTSVSDSGGWILAETCAGCSIPTIFSPKSRSPPKWDLKDLEKFLDKYLPRDQPAPDPPRCSNPNQEHRANQESRAGPSARMDPTPQDTVVSSWAEQTQSLL